MRQIHSTIRQCKKVNRIEFNRELALALPTNVDELRMRSAEDLFEKYESTLRRLGDKFAPQRTTVCRFKRLSPWFDEDRHKSRRLTRLFERQYKSSKSDGDQAAWITQVRVMHALYKQKENLYWTNCINAHGRDARKMWRSISSRILLNGSHHSKRVHCHSSSSTRSRLYVRPQRIQVNQPTMPVPMDLTSTLFENTHWTRYATSWFNHQLDLAH